VLFRSVQCCSGITGNRLAKGRALNYGSQQPVCCISGSSLRIFQNMLILVVANMQWGTAISRWSLPRLDDKWWYETFPRLGQWCLRKVFAGQYLVVALFSRCLKPTTRVAGTQDGNNGTFFITLYSGWLP